MKPILKWAGGKRFIAPHLRTIISTLTMRRYIEPFAGGAALFFELRPHKAVLSDTNEELINFYLAVRDFPDALVQCLKKFRNSEEDYYRIRGSAPRTAITRAARFYYLVRLSFNGIYRENLQGDFNVPFGHKTHLETVDPEAIYAASALLQRAKLRCRPFDKTVECAQAGDLIYFDPPYTVKHNNNGFIKYNKRLFSWSDQKTLADIAKALVQRDCFVIISNADHDDVSALYGGFKRIPIYRHSKISAKSYGRGETTESLFVSRNVAVDHRALRA